MMKGLEGLAILVPESRELDLFAAMLEDEGASTLRCPLVAIQDLEDVSEAEAWIDQLVAGAFDDIIWLTGEGLRRLLPIARALGQESQFITALGRVRNIVRGPKPARALREIGLAPGLAATTPTSQGVLDSLAAQDIAGRSIGLQLYPGDGAAALAAGLGARGAKVWPVTPYRYAGAAEDAVVVDAIEMMASGRVGMIVFTASPQIERLLEVAAGNGLSEKLATAFIRTPVAAMGPVVEDTLRHHGITAVLRPETSFHLKPLLRAILAWRSAS
jgi:uroporphyrinogen-III synthase